VQQSKRIAFTKRNDCSKYEKKKRKRGKQREREEKAQSKQARMQDLSKKTQPDVAFSMRRNQGA